MWGKKAAPAAALAGSLHDEKLKSSIILNAIEDGVVLIDCQGIIRVFNPGAGVITGWSAEEAEGLDWRLVFKFVDTKGQAVADNDTIFSKALTSALSIRDNAASLASKSNKTVAVSLSVSPLVDSTKTQTGVVGIFRDVSVERQDESRRADFISTASHEMRTPVAAIEGYLSLALNEKVANIDAKARDYLEKAHASTRHLGQLFQDLLTSAKAEDGRLTNHPRVIEIGSFTEQLVSDLKFSAEKKGLFLDSNLSSGGTAEPMRVVRPLYYALVDPERMQEVITNLFDNAVKYTDTGRITIGLTGNEQVVQLSIKDTGNGIPTEDVPHLFQKFYRVDNSDTRTIGGTGLGLFICRKIVELYQGRIWVESEFHKGSTFFINLPRLTTQKAEAMLAEESNNSGLGSLPNGGTV
ncbi:PAS domain-containing sensor histidine kinase [Aeromicrobium sp.]|nr:PAS domain-containing sensor histidine kinase [Candidatus Saccharibacteria bacterium]